MYLLNQTIMKKINLSILCIMLYSLLPAQEIVHTIEVNTPEKQKLVNAYSCFFQTYDDVSRIWKTGYSNFTNHALPNTSLTPSKRVDFRDFYLGIEQRIATGISLGLNIQSDFSNNILQVPNNDYESVLSAELNSSLYNIEARWYFQKRKQIQQNLSGNNLSGVYLGINGAVDVWNLSLDKFQLGEEVSRDLDRDIGINYQTFLAVGWQQLSKNGSFVNFRLGAGLLHTAKDLNTLNIEEENFQFTSINKWKGFLDYQVTWGFTIWEKRAPHEPKDCAILEYFESDNQLWKIDLFNVVDGLSDKGIEGKISLEYERKLGKSSFSINPLAEFYYHVPFSEKSLEHQFNFGTEFRYYYNLKRLMQKGLVGNSLFANYLATYVYHSPSISSRPRIGFQYGSQQRLFEKLYLDLKILFDAQTHRAEDNSLFDRFALQYKIGFAF